MCNELGKRNDSPNVPYKYFLKNKFQELLEILNWCSYCYVGEYIQLGTHWHLDYHRLDGAI